MPICVEIPRPRRRETLVVAKRFNACCNSVIATRPNTCATLWIRRRRIVTTQVDEMVDVTYVGRELHVKTRKGCVHTVGKPRVKMATRVFSTGGCYLQTPRASAFWWRIRGERNDLVVFVAHIIPPFCEVNNSSCLKIFHKQDRRIIFDTHIARVFRCQPGAL